MSKKDSKRANGAFAGRYTDSPQIHTPGEVVSAKLSAMQPPPPHKSRNRESNAAVGTTTCTDYPTNLPSASCEPERHVAATNTSAAHPFEIFLGGVTRLHPSPFSPLREKWWPPFQH